MGLLDEVLGQADPKGGIAKPLMVALGTLLVGKMIGHAVGAGQAAAQPAAASAPTSTTSAASAGAPDGGLVGGLSGLLEKLQNAGHGEAVSSWVGSGPNKPIDPGQLGAALGQNAVSATAQQAGVSEQELLSMLAQNLPQIVDKLTANGAIPNLQQIVAAFAQK